MIQTVKQNELARREYHILPAALMDAMDEGEARGLAEGSRRKALETAKNLLHFGLSREKYRASNRPNRIGDRNAGIMDDAFSAVS